MRHYIVQPGNILVRSTIEFFEEQARTKNFLDLLTVKKVKGGWRANFQKWKEFEESTPEMRGEYTYSTSGVYLNPESAITALFPNYTIVENEPSFFATHTEGKPN